MGPKVHSLSRIDGDEETGSNERLLKDLGATNFMEKEKESLETLSGLKLLALTCSVGG